MTHFAQLLMTHRASTARFSLKALAAIGLLLCTAGCGSSAPQAEANSAEATPKADPLADAPAWVMGDCRDEFSGQAVLCGVGSVSGVPSPSLARNTAMARGRTEIARYLQIEVKSVLSDYQAVKGGTVEQKIEDESRQIAEMTLSGSRMAKYHLGKDGTYYALMMLELETYKSAVSGSEAIPAPVKQALVERAGKTFSSRDSEVSRY